MKSSHRWLFTLLFLSLVGSFVKAQAPACWPDVKLPAKLVIADVPRGFNVKRVAFWTCATPTGYTNTWIAYNDAELAPWLGKIAAGTFTKAAADTACSAQCDLLYEDNLLAAVHKLQAPYLAKAVVAKNGDYTTRPVRSINADGSLGDVIASTIARAPVGGACWLNRRVSGSWYSVEGLPNMATTDPADKLNKVAASCAVTLPIGANGQ